MIPIPLRHFLSYPARGRFERSDYSGCSALYLLSCYWLSGNGTDQSGAAATAGEDSFVLLRCVKWGK